MTGVQTCALPIYKEFKEKKEFLDKELKSRDRKKYDVEREKLSALVTNQVNPPLMEWLEKNQNNANMFVRSLYTLATARSTNSAKYVIAK